MTKDEIITIVCEVCGVKPAELLGKTKNRQVTTAKHLIAHYLWREVGYSPQKVSSVVFLRPQTLYEVMYPGDIRARRESDIEFNELCNRIEVKIITTKKFQ
jgi:hypothetical protein